MSTFQTHTGTAFTASQTEGFHISIKGRDGNGGEEGPSAFESGPSEKHEQIQMEYMLFSLTATIHNKQGHRREGNP